MSQNRYDALRERIARRLSRSRSFDVDLSAGERTVVMDVSDYGEADDDDGFREHGPFTHVRVVADSDDATVFTRKDRGTSVDVSAGAIDTSTFTEERFYDFDTDGTDDDAEFVRGESRVFVPGDAPNVNDLTGQRYIGYVMVEAGSSGFTGTVYIANDVDSVELDLLKMAGLLDISE